MSSLNTHNNIPPNNHTHPERAIIKFAQLLRLAGIPVGTGDALNALLAASILGPEKTNFKLALKTSLVKSQEHILTFEEAFNAFFKAPSHQSPLPNPLPTPDKPKPPTPPAARRVAEALAQKNPQRRYIAKIIAAALAADNAEKLQSRDFEGLSTEEIAHVIRAAHALGVAVPPRPSRRTAHSPHGSILSLRSTLRHINKRPDLFLPQFHKRTLQPTPLVALCDISGSMAVYSRIFLSFLHGVVSRGAPAHVFSFGTRLTNLTPHLKTRDPDVALQKTAAAVRDWDGGTRIAHCIRQFHVHQARRRLARGGVVLLVTDGLERDDASKLSEEIIRLKRAASSIIWLNPLLRYDAFQPLAAGVRAILPHVNAFLPIHNLNSIAQLTAALSHPSLLKSPKTPHNPHKQTPQLSSSQLSAPQLSSP